MKKLFVPALMAVAALGAVSLVVLAPAPGRAMAHHSGGVAAAPPQDFVTGAGNHAGGVQFTISAHSGALGENPKGSLSFKIDGQARVRAEVTCVIIMGKQAFLTGTFTDQSGMTQLVVMHAVDNGEPGTSTVPDLLRFSFAGAIVPVTGSPGCYLPVLPPVPVTQGNIVVHDGQPR